ncbi:hypothetical protein [Methylomonas sp. MgM2]
MLELILLFMILCFFAAAVFSPLKGSKPYFSKSNLSENALPVSSSISAKRPAHKETVSFLSYLKDEIEADLFPRPTCSVLQRHYDSLVAAELENRLALMAE